MVSFSPSPTMYDLIHTFLLCSETGFMGLGVKTIFRVFKRLDVLSDDGWRLCLDTRASGLRGTTLPSVSEHNFVDVLRAFDVDHAHLHTAWLLSESSRAAPLRFTKLLPPDISLAQSIDFNNEQLQVFLAILACRGLSRLDLLDTSCRLARSSERLVDIAVDDGRRRLRLQVVSFSVQLDVSDVWQQYWQFRNPEKSRAEMPALDELPSFSVRAFVVNNNNKRKQQRQRRPAHLWCTLPTDVSHPFAFAIDAPFLLNVDRFLLLLLLHLSRARARLSHRCVFLQTKIER
jgi:hypothetical protein